MISAVIPTLNEEKYIGSVLSSIEAQTVPVSEIIVVDCGSKDATVDIARKFGARIVKSKVCNVGYQRDLGVISADGDVILMVDGDTVLSPKFVENSLKYLKPGVAVAPKFEPLNDNIPARVNLFIRSLFPIDFRQPGVLLFIKRKPWNWYFSQPLKGKWKDIQNLKRVYKIVQGNGIAYTEIPASQQFLTGIGLGILTGFVINKMR